MRKTNNGGLIMKTLETKKAPAAIGPYSQAKVVGNFVFASGQIPVDPYFFRSFQSDPLRNAEACAC